MKKMFTPRGVVPGSIHHRLATARPSTYSESERSVEAILSTGADVQRAYGIERLSIKPDAVDLTRISENAVPLLDSHNASSIKTVLGRVSRAWFSNGKLVGKLIFASTPEGKNAEKMVARGEISSVSIGYTVSRWKLYDADGDEIDPATQRINWDDNPIFEAVRWQLAETSLVSTPADAGASIRSLGRKVPKYIEDTRARMLARQRIIERMRW